MQLPKAEWTITGLIVERRILKSSKSEWQQPVVKIQTMGDTYEVQCDPKQYDRIGDGEFLQLGGRFERRAGKEGGSHLNFICERIGAAPAGQKAGAA